MVSDVNIFAKKFLKAPQRKKFFLRILPPCSLHLNVLFPPLPEDQCPNFLDFSESLGKTHGKKWSQMWILLLIKDVKSLNFNQFCLTSRIFFWYRCYYPHQSRYALSPVCRIFIREYSTSKYMLFLTYGKPYSSVNLSTAWIGFGFLQNTGGRWPCIFSVKLG